MIETDVIAYLMTDMALDTLLGSSGSNSKIYPIQVPQNMTLPIIIYNTSYFGGFDENIKEISMAFNCISKTYSTAKSIRDRLIYLLDKQDTIQGLITSASYFIYYCKLTGGDTFIYPDTNDYHTTAIFDFKFNKVA